MTEKVKKAKPVAHSGTGWHGMARERNGSPKTSVRRGRAGNLKGSHPSPMKCIYMLTDAFCTCCVTHVRFDTEVTTSQSLQSPVYELSPL